MLRVPAPALLLVLGSLCASASRADDPAFPASLTDAAQQFDPSKVPAAAPSPPPPSSSSSPTTPSPSAEPTEVDGWRLVEFLSPRRTHEGQPTSEPCGYERDVVVERTRDGRPQRAQGVLQVPCTRGPAGVVVGQPVLRLPAGLDAPAPTAAPVDKEDGLVEVGVAPTLKKDPVIATLASRNADVAACHPGGKGGRLTMRIVVGVDGRITEAAGTGGALRATPVDGCVAGKLKGLSLVKPSDGRPALVAATWAFVDRPEATTAATPPGTPPAAGAAPAPATADKPKAEPPKCKAGEKPKAAAELKPGEVACVEEKPKQRLCAEGEKPKTLEELAHGEIPCKELGSTRGVAFLKGELTHLGDVQLVNARSSFGLGLGLNFIDGVIFGVLRPDLNLKFGAFQMGLGAPLRFELADTTSIDVFGGDPVGDVFGEFGRFRLEDWDQTEDFLRPLRYVTYGRKEDKLYVNVNRVNATTIGHGQLVRRYTPNIDIDEDNLFANFDAYGDWGGVELMAGPFPLPRMVGGLAFVKPLGIAQDFNPLAEDGSYLQMMLDSWSVGLSYVTDLNAPTGLEGRFNPGDQRPQLAIDAANQFVWRNKNNPVGDVVQGIGLDTEIKLLKLENFDIKAYADYSHLFFPGDSSSAAAWEAFSGGGATLGALVRISAGAKPVRPMDEEPDEVQLGKKPREKKAAHALRFRLEGRTFASTYLPSYWNTMYEVDRFQFGDARSRATLPTKIGFLAGKQGEPLRVGYYAEASYAWVDAWAVTAAFEDAYATGEESNLRAKNLALHFETAGLGWLQFFASYHYRNFETEDFDRAFRFNSDNQILFAGVRLQILPIMFLNFATQRAFRVGFTPDDSPGQIDDKGLRYTSTGLQNAWNNGFDVELGWQF